MDALKLLSHSKLTHESLNTFARRAMAHVAGFQDDEFITRQTANLEQHVEEMDHAFQRVLKDSFTRALNELDLRRDAIILAIRDALEAAISQSFLNAKKAEAAEKIMALYKNMDKKVTKLGYNEESAQISAFLTSIASLEETVVQTAGVVQLVQALTETQSEFDTTMEKRDGADITQITPRTIRSIRTDMIFRIENILTYVRANGVDLPDQYSETITNINALITEVMAKAKADQTRRENIEA